MGCFYYENVGGDRPVGISGDFINPVARDLGGYPQKVMDSYTTRNWQNALSYCEGLSWASHEDWRLPDIKELASIVDDHAVDPPIDTLAFHNTPSADFWSSSSYAGSPPLAWYVNFSDGNMGALAKSSTHVVRCVRSGP